MNYGWNHILGASLKSLNMVTKLKHGLTELKHGLTKVET